MPKHKMKNQYIATSPFQTKRIGKIFAKELLKKSKGRQIVIIGLIGELGSGKTTFLQGFAKGLGIKAKILSPTFIICRKFPLYGFSPRCFYHLDCYRIQRAKEMFQIGFREILAGPTNIVAIEWADKVQKILPKNTLMLKFEFIDENTRRITMETKSVKLKEQSHG